MEERKRHVPAGIAPGTTVSEPVRHAHGSDAEGRRRRASSSDPEPLQGEHFLFILPFAKKILLPLAFLFVKLQFR